MKKILTLFALAVLTTSLSRVRATVYLPTGNKTATGIIPYEGIIASNSEHLGQSAFLYTENMELIGLFECQDTGGHKGLKDGSRIDIFRNSEGSYREWVRNYGDYVYIQWMEAKE